jgi:hypothetical protein
VTPDHLNLTSSHLKKLREDHQMSLHNLLQRTASGESLAWVPTTLHHLGKSEDYLETVLAETPSLLGLETRRSGIRQPFQVFRQLPLPTPSGRVIYPDIVFLAASGHVVVVEVKLSVNSELRDRSVIAQIIDYAASFSALDDDQRVQLFATDKGSASDWHKMVHQWFPEDDNPDELADTFLERMRQGELNLVIACDKIPPGTEAMVASIASQRALGFDLDLVETRPFVCDGTEGSDIVFASSTWLETRIVARTAVTINYREGDVQPSSTVLTTSLEEVNEKIKAETSGRLWSAEEIEETISTIGDPTLDTLLTFAKTESTRGKYTPSDRRQNPSFMFYLEGRGPDDGVLHKRVVFSYIAEWNSFSLYMNSVDSLLGTVGCQQFLNTMVELFGESTFGGKIVTLPMEAVASHIEPFLDAMKWLKVQVLD